MVLKNIVIDRGNTLTKTGLFEGDQLLEVKEFTKVKKVVEYINESGAERLLISNVAGKSGKILKKINDGIVVYKLNHKSPLPFVNLYDTPKTLGADRIAAVAGAVKLFPQKNCLVIDTGTCIKYDFVDAAGKYSGGAISPGLNMRFKALQKFTSKLPLVSFSNDVELVGTSTTGSIRSGVVHGVLSEVEGMIAKYREKYNDLTVIVCGGDSNFFESKLKGHIFAVANLVLIGLNHILLQNIKHFEVDN